MHDSFIHLQIDFFAVLNGSSATVNWNSQGPIKVDDIYSCENIPSAYGFMFVLAVIRHQFLSCFLYPEIFNIVQMLSPLAL